MSILTQEDKSPGFTYLALAVGTPRYKVGRTNDLERRMGQLNCQSCYPVRLLESNHTGDCISEESRLHRILEDFRVHGEWFELEKWCVQSVQHWFYDSECWKISKKTNTKSFVIRTSAEQNPKVFRIKEYAFQSADPPFNIPKTNGEIHRALTLLGNLRHTGHLRPSKMKELRRLLGCTPKANEVSRWKKTIKDSAKLAGGKA